MSASSQLRLRQRKARESVAQRRAQIMQLRLAGTVHQETLAEHFGVSRKTISLDLQAIDNDYRILAARERAMEKGIDLARIDAMIRPLWPQAIAGDLRAQEMMHKWLKRRADILGYDAATATSISVAVGQPTDGNASSGIDFSQLTDQQRMKLYESIEATIIEKDNESV